MTTINYAAMTDQELKRYMLEHRDDTQAFYAYMDRRNARAHRDVIAPDDPDWEAKFKAMVERQVGRGG